jgi:hypothetical protein
MNSTVSSNTGLKAFRPLLVVFLLINAGIFGARSLLAKWNISADVLLVGHLILFIATAVSFYFYYKSFQDSRPQAFVRFIYAGMFIKMALCLFSSFLYIMISAKDVNKGGIIGCMVFYALYTVLEVVILMKVSKQKKNA